MLAGCISQSRSWAPFWTIKIILCFIMVSTVSEICLKLNVSQMSVRYRPGKLKMFSCGLEVRVRGLNLDSSILFWALSLTHHVTLDQSTELSGPTLFLWKENRTDDIIDYLWSSHFQYVLRWGHCLFIPDKRPQLSIWPPSRFLFILIF